MYDVVLEVKGHCEVGQALFRIEGLTRYCGHYVFFIVQHCE